LENIKKVEANLTKIYDDPIHAILLGPPAVTTLEPTSGDEDEDEMTLTGAWVTPSLPIDPPPVNDISPRRLIVVPQQSLNLLPVTLGMRFMEAMMTIVMMMTSLVMIRYLTMNLRSNPKTC
jgi:hypothetical protein